MNEILLPEHSAYQKGIRTPEDAIGFISRRMLEHRPRVELTLRPYFRQEHMALMPVSGPARLDLEQTYPTAGIGDIAYIQTSAFADRDCEAALNVAGNAEIWFNGEKVYASDTSAKTLNEVTNSDYRLVNVQMHEGGNTLLIKCRKRPENWGLILYIAYPRYPFRWTRDYLLSVRPMLPFAETEGMEGFAHIGPVPAEADTQRLEQEILLGRVGYHDSIELSGRILQWQPRWNEACLGSRVDFAQVYGASTGCAYALTCVQTEDGEQYALSLEASSPVRIWIDGQEVPAQLAISFAGNGKEKRILVKQARCTEEWWLQGAVYAGQTGECVNCVPFVRCGGHKPLRWIVIGPFTTDFGDEMHIPFPPEQEIQFTRPCPLGNYQHAFWRVPQPETYIRPYRDGIFFGQWFYAVQVGLHGLMFAAKTTKNSEHLQYYLDSIQTMAEYYDYMKWEKDAIGDPTLTPRAWGLPDLDACGTIGVSMIETYEITGNPKLLQVISEIGEAIMRRIPRFEDGTFHRDTTMWADDLYMSCPFLTRLARLTGNRCYTQEVYRQIRGFKKRLWIEEENLFSHIFFLQDEMKSSIPWGRGNGWIAVTLTEALGLFSKEEEDWAEVLALYRSFMQGVLACQDASGLWHQVLNRSDSYLETSCTAMFVLAFARGVRNGWLDEHVFLPAAKKGWEALMKHSVDEFGDAYGVCLGSGCARQPEYYFDLPTKKNDDHGTGIILMAASELIRLSKQQA